MIRRRLIGQISIYISLLLLSSGCTSPNKTNIPLEDPRIIPLEKPTISSQKNELNKLPEPEELESHGKLNTQDPFSNTYSKNKTIKGFKLTGIIDDSINKFALVEYIDRSGTIKIGDLGGTTTNLLPSGISVKEIDLVNQQIILIEEEDEIFLGI